MKIRKFSLIAALLLSAVFMHSANAQTSEAQAETNKKIVMAFYDAALVQLDADKALIYMGSKYIQHNPIAPDGVEGLKGLIKFLKQKYPDRKSEVKRVVAQDDLVVLHVHSKNTPEERGNAIVDIFRLENGKIVEHWDVIQPVPEKSANANTMF